MAPAQEKPRKRKREVDAHIPEYEGDTIVVAVRGDTQRPPLEETRTGGNAGVQKRIASRVEGEYSFRALHLSMLTIRSSCCSQTHSVSEQTCTDTNPNF